MFPITGGGQIKNTTEGFKRQVRDHWITRAFRNHGMWLSLPLHGLQIRPTWRSIPQWPSCLLEQEMTWRDVSAGEEVSVSLNGTPLGTSFPINRDAPQSEAQLPF